MVEKGRGGSKTYRKGMDRERGRANLKGGNSSAFIDEYFTLNFFPPQFWENYSHFLGFTFGNSSNFLLALTFLGYLFSFFSCDNFSLPLQIFCSYGSYHSALFLLRLRSLGVYYNIICTIVGKCIHFTYLLCRYATKFHFSLFGDDLKNISLPVQLH